MPHKFNPERMAMLVSPDRHQRQPPERLLRAIGLPVGARVADIGCGPGFYSLPAAQLVGPTGTVYALDLEEAMLHTVRSRAAEQGITNVETLQSEENRFPLADGSVDVALVANVLHECADQGAFLREARRVVVDGGRLAVIEWRKEPMPMGPPLSERMTVEDVRRLLLEAGFPALDAVDPAATGPTHFGWVGVAG